MNFTSPLFVFVVLPLVLGGYWLCPDRFRNALLLSVGVALYAWGAPEFVVVVFLLSVFDWLLAFRIARAPVASRRRRALITLGVAANLTILALAKYANFGAATLNAALGALERRPIAWTEIALPIGVSFVIFEKISYLVDVGRGTVRPLASLRDYLLYTFLFPKMLAGPIVRFHTIEGQLARRRPDDADRAYGLSRFSLGLAKKVLVANTLSGVADDAFNMPIGQLNMPTAWLGAFCFTLQVYFDFSGYSDMAIGMARCFGFRLSENFAYPYAAASLREFWERWHISLSSWIREYLYIPLGGNRVSELRTHVNLWICFLGCGLWHGAAWTFVLWGAMHGAGLTVQRYYERHGGKALPRAASVPLTFLFIVVTMVAFRAPSFAVETAYYRALFSVPKSLLIQVFFDPVATVVLRLALCLSLFPALPLFHRMRAWLSEQARDRVLLRASAFPLLLLAAARVLGTGANPFLYFRF